MTDDEIIMDELAAFTRDVRLEASTSLLDAFRKIKECAIVISRPEYLAVVDTWTQGAVRKLLAQAAAKMVEAQRMIENRVSPWEPK